ncbi:GH3 auxin-responsive promoter [Rubidibacter lacunae KORDI 51-2]|uniref:GH3 auxin-responsive promoter n=1 Tax=Rubidibacter lacunae KORDI 51-2 TaxID=582515 RepID=U5DGY1_9CHRO|nr:GH3 auxin-responsive promoter family protein [Rubidibacter lacunae]ERN40856.1 GH3 auxin-responsive promoter [Rubidibacter lacunae KORDI 51-2]
MQTLVAAGLSTLFAPLKASFIAKTHRVASAQEEFLLRLLRVQQDTQLGRDYQLSAIASVREFRHRIPVLPYSSFAPYVERVAGGEANVMTPDPVIYMNMTSGSTGKQKLIPVTRRSRRFRHRASQVSLAFLLSLMQQQRRSFGQILLTSSVELLGKTSGGIDYGPVSVGDLRLQNPIVRNALLSQPFATLEATDSAARHYVSLLFALNNPNARIVAANFPILALILCEYLERYADRLLDDLERGTITSELMLEPELRARLERQLHPMPQRVARLRSVLKAEGTLTPQLAWPDLSLIITARGGNSDFYFQRFPDYFGDTPVFGGTYSTAETVFGICPAIDRDGAMLALDSGFYEFIPAEEWDSSQPRTLLPEEVEVGQTYRILVTNYNGFYRYDLGDVVEVLGFYARNPIVVFRHRRGGLLSSTTEKTTEYHAAQVMNALQQEFDLTLEDFCITLAAAETPPPYLVNIELAAPEAIADPHAFLRQFDRRLKEVHTSYAVKRRRQVPPPCLRVLPRGSFHKVRQRLLANGIPEHHLKFPHISEDRQFLKDIPVELEVCLLDDRVTGQHTS